MHDHTKSHLRKKKYTFVTKSRALEIDVISKRYGKLPSELLSLSLEDYQFDLLIASTAIEEELKEMKKSHGEKRGSRT